MGTTVRQRCAPPHPTLRPSLLLLHLASSKQHLLRIQHYSLATIGKKQVTKSPDLVATPASSSIGCVTDVRDPHQPPLCQDTTNEASEERDDAEEGGVGCGSRDGSFVADHPVACI